MPIDDATLDAACYQRNFLGQVIVRVDLLNPISGLATQLPPALVKSFPKRFPIPEPRIQVLRTV